jgi:hypothetical protein
MPERLGMCPGGFQPNLIPDSGCVASLGGGSNLPMPFGGCGMPNPDQFVSAGFLALSALLNPNADAFPQNGFSGCCHAQENQQNQMMQMLMKVLMVALLVNMIDRLTGGRTSGDGFSGNPYADSSAGRSLPGGRLGRGNGPGYNSGGAGDGRNPGNGNDGSPGGDAGFDGALRKVLKYEGGLSNDPDDRGGLTNKGITQGTFNGWLRKQGRGSRSVASITNEEVRQIYYENYWKASGADRLPGNLGMAVFDTAVNMGVGTAKKMLAESGGDINRFLELREQRYHRIATRGNNRKFLKGWLSRLNDLKQSVA